MPDLNSCAGQWLDVRCSWEEDEALVEMAVFGQGQFLEGRSQTDCQLSMLSEAGTISPEIWGGE